MFTLLLASGMSLFTACSDSTARDTSLKAKLEKAKAADVQQQYKSLCTHMEDKRKSLAKEYSSATTKTDSAVVIKKARTYLERVMTDSLFVYWYGTDWDFNGVTQEPRKGLIACGYFVTTTLQQAGLPIRRSWMAQQASSVMIRALCESSNVKTISNNQLDKLKKYLLAQDDGIWIIGLDNHTGFIVKKGSSLDFVHANYLPPKKVARVTMEDCEIIKSSGIYVVGKIFAGERALKAWLTGDGAAISGN